MRKTFTPSRIILFCLFVIASTFGKAQSIVWNFSDGTANPANTIANLSSSVLTQGNNNGTTTFITSTSASSGYVGATGTNNAGLAARVGALNTAAVGSPYIEFTLTPASGYFINLTGINFGVRSTSTGPQAYTLRSNLDAYSTDIVTGTITNNSSWSLKSNAGLNVVGTLNTPVIFRLYGYNGAGSPGVNTANFRFDDITVSANASLSVISNNAKLSSLSTSVGSLVPNFSSLVNNYTVAVPSTTGSVLLNFTKAESNATVTARIDGGVYGNALLAFPLNVGNNVIDIKVTAQDGITTNIYTLTINRATPAVPLVLLNSGLADFGNVCINNSSVNSFTLNGNDLDGSAINISALTGFSYSLNPGGPFTSTLSIPYSGAVLASTQVYVQFSAVLVQAYDGTIQISGGGITPVPFSATASGINTHASVNTGTSVVGGTTATLNGTGLLAGCSPITAYGFEYSTTAGFANGTGTQVSAINVNAGTFSKSVTGLNGATTYYYKAFVTDGTSTYYGLQSSFATSSVVPVIMSAQPLFRYAENFADINNWQSNFTGGIGANRFSSVAVNATGTIPSATRITTATASFSSGTSGGVQRGLGNIQLLSTGATDNTSAAAIEFYMDFSGMNTGTLSFDWASVNNSTGNRNGSLRVYGTVDGTSYTELVTANVLNFTNNVPSTGVVNNIALPAIFNNSSTARLRFYYHNGTGGSTGSRPKISIDNLTVTGVPAIACVAPTANPSSLTFPSKTETTIQGSFLAANPAVNEYLVIMSTASSLTSNPLDGQTYTIGDNIGDGTVIAKGSDLTFNATGLTGSTTYYFFVFPVNSVCTGGPLYLTTNVLTEDETTQAGLPACAAPLLQPTNLQAAVAINSIQGNFTAVTADEYLVLQSTDASLTQIPLNGVVYNAGAVLGNAVVIQRNANSGFVSNNLNPATTYYYFVFSINSQTCVNGPAYQTVDPLTGSFTTLPLPVCVTPASQATNLSFQTSNNSVTGTFNLAGNGLNYLVVRSSAASLNALPQDNIDYGPGASLGGGTVVSNNAAGSFSANGLLSATTYYFFVFSANKNCTGGTKYLTASPLTGNATTTNAPVNNYYFGTLHSHSDYSDGNKDNPGFTPAQNYAYAAQSLGMDFLGISEHNHFSSLDNPGNELAKYHLGVAQAAAFNASNPNFLALYGMEWGVISGGGHVVVYGDGLSELFGWESNVNGSSGPNYDVYVPKSVYTGASGLFKTVNDYAAKNAFTTLAHPNNTDFNNLSNSPYDQAADDAISGTAVESGPSTSTNTTYSNPGSSMFYLWYYQKLLSKGYHLGPVIDHDNHNTTFGRTTASRTAVIAPSLTQTDLIKAVKDMHFYATQDLDAKVDFTINTRIMGSIFADRNAPAISVNITDPSTNTSNALIRVMFGIPGSGINPVVKDSVFGSTLNFVDNGLANNATGYYYIDITNGTTRIVTSPIWYTRTCSASSELNITACGSYTWGTDTYTSSATITKSFTTLSGCDSTVTLHLIINNNPVSATLALDGSDTGCPGTGVPLTATINDGGNGAIVSYEWIKDGNSIATTNGTQYNAPVTGTYSVKAINANNCYVLSNSISLNVVDIIAPVPIVETLPVLTGACSVTVSAIPTALDNCAGIRNAQTTDPLSYTQQGTYTITWTYNDGNGNSSSQTQTVIVQDTEKPLITAPFAYSVVNDAGVCGATLLSIGTPLVQDNCGIASVTNNHPATFYPIGTTEVIWTVTDVNGNVTDTAKQLITVIDNEIPTISVSNINAVADAGQCYATITLATPVTNDNCGIASVVNNHPGSQFAVGVTPVTWTVTDNNGWTNTVIQTITVTDTQKPLITAPFAYSVVNDAGVCGATLISIGTPLVQDNCGIASVTNNHPSTFYPVGTTEVTWTVTDVNGNITDTAKQLITVIDNELPTINVNNINAVADAGQCFATITLSTPVTNDNCGIVSVVNNHPSTQFAVGVTSVTWTVTDNTGWTNTVIQTVTVTDTQLPTITVTDISVNNTAGLCNANVVLAAPVVADNCGIASVTNNHPSPIYNVGTTDVIWTVTDIHGLTSTAVQHVMVVDAEAPIITTPGNLSFCFNNQQTYSIPVIAATDNCGLAFINYVITGATNRSGSGTDASGLFNQGLSVITYTATDVNGRSQSASINITVTGLPSNTAITVSNADAFCNQLVLTANSNASNASYLWFSGNTALTNTKELSLGQTNADGVYSVIVIANGCSSAPANYTYTKQNLLSAYTIVATDFVSLGENNTVGSGSIGVTAPWGSAWFRKNSSVTAPGSFVKARFIQKLGYNINISNPITAAATGIALPTMFLNTANTNNLPSKEVAKNSTSTINGNYRNLTLKKGSNTTLTGTVFGSIKVEQGARVKFTAATISIGKMDIDKGPKQGYSYVQFASDTKLLISDKVVVGSQVYINPDNYKVTFYLGDQKSDEEQFVVKGGDTKITANVFAPRGKIKVTGGYSYGDSDDDDERNFGQGNSYVYMTGTFIAKVVEGNGKNIIWNSFTCGAVPVAVATNDAVITQSGKAEEKLIITSEEELKVTVMPNPSTTYFTLKLESKYQTTVEMRVMDGAGRVVDAKSKLGANSTLQIGQNYSSGTYYAELIQGGIRRVVQLVKVKG